MILRARAVVPLSKPPIQNGAILISGNRIKKVGRWNDFTPQADEKVFDFGDTVLLPGLVNAHCHLDYTEMAGRIPPQKSFTDWINLMLSAKSAWSYSEFAESWIHGAQMLARTGTTTVADIEAVPELLPDIWNATPLRVFSFFEMTGIKSRHAPRSILSETLEQIESLPTGRCKAGLSPHAPYSTTTELLRLCAEAASKKRMRITTHVAESGQEFEMFARSRGEMFQWLKRNERDMSDCGFGSPVQRMERLGILRENFLAVHANYLDEGDAALLAKRKASVVHCPRSHAYFKHQAFPLEKLLKAKVNVCLGTDSLATVAKTPRQKIELNLFEEMRALEKSNPGLSPKVILQMATLNGALALGMSGEIGELSGGAFADVIAVPFAGKIADVHDDVLHHPRDVAASMINGEWVIAPP